MTPRHTLRLKSGATVRVETVHYPYGRSFFRVSYRKSDHELRGVVAELGTDGVFTESDMEAAIAEVEGTWTAKKVTP